MQPTDTPALSMSIHYDHLHLPWGVEQVGWLGQTGAVYALDDPPYDDREPGSFTPLYQARDESCGHTQTVTTDPYLNVADPRRDVPGYEGSIGPGPRKYNRPHVYARDVQSGAGNCVCGSAPGDWIHTEIAPGYPIPNDRRQGVRR